MPRDRRLLLALLERLEATCCLSVPVSALPTVVDDILKENR
jgi:hypothetical protein